MSEGEEAKELVEYQIGQSQVPGSPDFYMFNLEQLKFLEEFAKDLDLDRAVKATYTNRPDKAKNRLLTNKHVRAELELIYNAWRANLRMTAEQAGGRHIQLMDKIEADYDSADIQDRAKLATSLVRASDSYLRATGRFNHGSVGSEPQVIINIDMGDGELKIDGSEERNE